MPGVPLTGALAPLQMPGQSPLITQDALGMGTGVGGMPTRPMFPNLPQAAMLGQGAQDPQRLAALQQLAATLAGRAPRTGGQNRGGY